MLVMSYLIKDKLAKNISKNEVIALYKEYYEGEQFVKIIEDDVDYMLVISRLDNLGKGASGAAVQNMNIMLGLDKKLGLKL